jgi:G2/mitotic-specific cyclin 1/2
MLIVFPDSSLACYSSYPESSLIPTVNLILNYILKPISHKLFYKKYASKKFMKVRANGLHV